MAEVVWANHVLQLLQELPQNEQVLVVEKARNLELFPRMYPVRVSGRFPRHRWYIAGNWLVYYRVVGDTVYIRGLWPARIP